MATTYAQAITLTLKIQAALTKTQGLNVSAVDTILKDMSDTLANGTGADQADKFCPVEVSLAAAPTDVDLSGGLTDWHGNTLTAARVKGLLVINTHATGVITVGGAPANAWATMFGAATHQFKVRPLGLQFSWAPDATAYAVTAGTGDLLRLDPGADTILCYLIIIASSV